MNKSYHFSKSSYQQRFKDLPFDAMIDVSCNNCSVVIDSEFSLTTARNAALSYANKVGFNQPNSYYVATAVSELASNIVFHANSTGVIVLRAQSGRRPHTSQSHYDYNAGVASFLVVEVEAIDSGRGIDDIDLAVLDGYSTREGSLGFGLPGVTRLLDEMHIVSGDKGTTVRGRKYQCG